MHINVYPFLHRFISFLGIYVRDERRAITRVALALALVALTSVVLGTVTSVIQTSRTVSNAGSVKGVGVGVYWNLACTNRTSSINWGLLDPGSNRTVTVYVRNEGNAPATLTKTVQSWNPSTASSYLTLNWNYAGQTLSANQVLQLKLTLLVSSAITGISNFSFDTIVIATA